MSDFSARLIRWHKSHGRHDLPWQSTRDPYRIWVSEVMLQQTTVAAVIPYWERFLVRFPDAASLAGNPTIETVIPKDGALAGVYIQGISAYAPHPNAAKLWMEYLYSDEGQLIWLKGGCHPIRYNDLAKRGVIPADVAAKLPAAELYANAVFPSIEQINNAKKAINDNWDKVVGADVK